MNVLCIKLRENNFYNKLKNENFYNNIRSIRLFEVLLNLNFLLEKVALLLDLK